MDVTLKVDGVLTQPTRARLFELLGDLKRPAGTDELAGLLGMHPNGIRNHLERMAEAGLVIRERNRRGRGRPGDIWAIDPEASPGGEAPTAYAELSGWLAKALENGAGEAHEIEEFGREIGLGLTDGESPEIDPERRLQDALAAMGFQPTRQPGSEHHVTYRLNNCPYRETARSKQQLICGLHRGITIGLVESIDPDSTLTEFVVRDPDRAGCEIKVAASLAGSDG